MIGGDDAGKGTSRCYQEGFEWESELIEGRIATSCANDAEGSYGDATETAQDAALEGGSGRGIRTIRSDKKLEVDDIGKMLCKSAP